MRLSLGSILVVVISQSIVLGVTPSPAAAITCDDCVYDADGDGFNEVGDDGTDICVGEASPTWSASCEAWDFNDDGGVGLDDTITFLNECGSDIACSGGCADCIYDADGDGFNEVDDDLTDICLGEVSPTWSATCEAYDLNGNLIVDVTDINTWLTDCGGGPILCGAISPPIPAFSPTGLSFAMLAMMVTIFGALYAAHMRRTAAGLSHDS